jgi:large subunit ribosomal protein L19
VFPVNSPNIDKIEIEHESENMRARMYYLRQRTGKAAMAVKKKRYEEEVPAAAAPAAEPAAPAPAAVTPAS